MQIIDLLKSSFWKMVAKSDRLYICLKYKRITGEWLHISHPRTFSEKLNWLKIYNRDPLYTVLVDKYQVKEYVANAIGQQYVVPNYGVYDSFDTIDFASLPEQFVMKVTHDSSGAVICRDKSSFDVESAKEKIESSLSQNYARITGEWPYYNVKPRIIVDKFLDDHSGKELIDYKFMCFDGEPKLMYFTNKGAKIFENFYDMDFAPVDASHGFDRMIPEFEKPEQFELMKELATKLSNGIPFVRIDFFLVDGHVYFGEYTFFDWAGFKLFTDKKWEEKLGSWIKISL